MLNLTLKKIIIASFLACFLATPYLLKAQSYNFTNDTGLQSTGKNSGFNQNKTNPEDFIQPVITAVLSLIGVLFLGLAIFGGLKWMTAKGNQQQVDQAQSVITNAVIGIVIVAAAYAISYFILKGVASQSFKVL